MKVLIMAGFTKSLVTFRGDLISDMVLRGHEVVACAPEEDASGELARLGARFASLPFQRSGLNPFSEIRLMRAYKRLLQREKPDVLFCYTIKPNLYGPPAAKKAGIKRVYIMVTGLGNTFLAGGAKGFLLRGVTSALYRRAIRRCDRVIFQNPDDREEFLRRKLATAECTVMVNGSGVNMEYFQPSALPEEPTFLMVSRLLREKGVMDYLAACRILRSSGCHATCALLGPYEAHHNAISPAELEPFIKDGSAVYWGETADVRPFLAQCTVLVLPSYREGTPRSVLEAMACARAVIASDVPGCRETVIHGKTGLLVPPKNPEALASAMAELAERTVQTAAMGQAGLMYCREKYDVRAVNRDMLAIMGL